MEKQGALKSLVILDLTRVLCGPFSSMLLADMGAEIIKIENPNSGDDTRSFAPFRNGDSMYFANFNRNKKSITLNLKSTEGKEMFFKLVSQADVVMENFRPGVMDKLGIGYDVLKKVNDQIIYAAVSGFGSYGPYSNRPGYDILSQAMGGLMSVTGWPDGPPTRAGNGMGDILAGMFLTIGILAAIQGRNSLGKGQRVDIALVDSVVATLGAESQRYFATGTVPERLGNRYAPIAPYDSFKAKNGRFIIACGNQRLYKDFCCNVIHRPELWEDERFHEQITRVQNQTVLKEIIEAWAANYTVDEVVDIVMAGGVPAGPILDLEQIAQNEHIVGAREMFINVTHPVIGPMNIIGNPIKLMDTMPNVRTPAPTLGQHNVEVYSQWLGIGSDMVKSLQDKGVV